MKVEKDFRIIAFLVLSSGRLSKGACLFVSEQVYVGGGLWMGQGRIDLILFTIQDF